MGKQKMDKLVGGNRVKSGIKWSTQIDLDPGKDSFITLSGSAPDEIAAALQANAARKAIMDSLNAEAQLKSEDDKPETPKSSTLTAKSATLPRGTTVQ